MLAVVKDPGDQPWSSKKVPSVGPGAGHILETTSHSITSLWLG